MADIRFEKHGTFWLARYCTDAGESWLGEFVPCGEPWGDTAVVVEEEHVHDLAEGAARDGLVVDIV